MKNGAAPNAASQEKLIAALRRCANILPNEKIKLFGGVRWNNPAFLKNKIDANTVVATIYKDGSEWFFDVIGVKDHKQFKEALANAGGQDAWSVAMSMLHA